MQEPRKLFEQSFRLEFWNRFFGQFEGFKWVYVGAVIFKFSEQVEKCDLVKMWFSENVI